MRKIYILVFLLCYLPFSSSAAETDSLKVWRDSVNASYHYQTGTIVLKEGLAKITVPKGYKFLDGRQSSQVLTELWGNPPSESMGMLFPVAAGPADADTWAIDVTYSEDGYIKDDDAKDIDYDELLEEMQADTEYENEAREAEGYQPVKLIGWAVPPFYDAAAHKLHWAKELQFGEEQTGVNTLNYNIRILGRKGYLQLNAIGDMSMVKGIQADVPGILASVEFNEGNRYADFDPGVDKVAAYGIGGLIAGKVLAKVGFFAVIAKFFKVILIGALKFWKLIALALVGLFSGIKRFFGKKRQEAASEEQDLEAVSMVQDSSYEDEVSVLEETYSPPVAEVESVEKSTSEVK
ncbi:DUF2167 domain-containing protein [Rufibacter quisquiliarum]|uniref:Putative membrane-anchored protein n=1 Tax=Rufibacter quisquiliarum TaxID=1549639 RepID=A0A839GCK0_9BACT|nr:DUF2167 domain-containing protein [Rufibacter quisquiliarum]MBA9077314.1 putative membrane-anchored protein [Rufibacter quisquiliarum]